MARKTDEEPQFFDHNADRFPDIEKVFSQIAADCKLVDGHPEHLEIHFLASGEATWRMWCKGQEEPVGNVFLVG